MRVWRYKGSTYGMCRMRLSCTWWLVERVLDDRQLGSARFSLQGQMNETAFGV